MIGITTVGKLRQQDHLAPTENGAEALIPMVACSMPINCRASPGSALPVRSPPWRLSEEVSSVTRPLQDFVEPSQTSWLSFCENAASCLTVSDGLCRIAAAYRTWRLEKPRVRGALHTRTHDKGDIAWSYVLMARSRS